MEKIRLVTEPDSTKTRISRCTDYQALPVKIIKIKIYLNLSEDEYEPAVKHKL